MIDYLLNTDALPLIFAGLMGLSMLIYAVLDGYDLGVGMLCWRATPEEQDTMIHSIGPFWDANETWLVLGVGILLVAFPVAHGIILTSLYLPVLLMLIGLIFRGVAYEFRQKAPMGYKKWWTQAFSFGSLLTALSQGYMTGSFIIAFNQSLGGILFSSLVAISVAAGYCLVGGTWLILRTGSELQRKSIRWSKESLIGCAIAIGLISVATPLVSTRIFEKWFGLPETIALLPIPMMTLALLIGLAYLLKNMPFKQDKYSWAPFATTIMLFVLCFQGLAYSFYPYIVPEQLTIVEAASAPESLLIIFFGTVIVLPILFGYTFVAYRIFSGKAESY